MGGQQRPTGGPAHGYRAGGGGGGGWSLVQWPVQESKLPVSPMAAQG